MGSKVTVTLGKLVNGFLYLQTLSNMAVTEFKIGYAIGKALDAAESPVKRHGQLLNAFLIEELSAKAKPDGSIEIDPKDKNYTEKVAKLQKFRDEAYETSIELTGIIMVDLEKLKKALVGTPILDKKDKPTGKIDEVALSPAMIGACNWFIESK